MVSAVYPSLRGLLDEVLIYRRQGADHKGEATYPTTPEELSCLIAGGGGKTVRDHGETFTADWSVVLAGDVQVSPGDKLSSGVNRKGEEILDSGVVVRVNDGLHPRRGRVVREALVKRGTL